MDADDISPEDPRLALWSDARDRAGAADSATLDRAAGCLAVGLADMVASARVPRHRAAAEALAGVTGPCTVSGSAQRADLPGAVVANAYLMHARLTDDSFRVAAHPGLAVVPVALAAVERAAAEGRQVDGTALLRALVGGYECACRLAERLLPEVSRRGWRITSVIAPLAAAATMALVRELPDDDACAALALAAGATGGPLGTVSTGGDGWRLQPALAVQAGVSAALAAASGLRSGVGSLTGAHGLYALFGGPDADTARRPADGAAIHHVTFKRYPVAMYGQAIFDALRGRPPLRGALDRVVVRVAPFAAGYGGQGGASTDSIASVEGITIAALRAFHPDLAWGSGPDGAPVEVVGDPSLPDLGARVRLELSDGRRLELTGDGDTGGWGPEDFRAHCVDLLGDPGGRLFEAAAALTGPGGVAGLLRLWRTAR